MAEERALRDARITVKIDTVAAQRQLAEMERGIGDGRSRPGGKPPRPGAREQDRERDDRRRDRDEKRRDKKTTILAPVAATGKVFGALKGALKLLIAVEILKFQGEILTGVIDVAVSKMKEGLAKDISEDVSEFLKVSLGFVDDVAAAVISKFSIPGTAIDVAKGQFALIGKTSPVGIANVALMRSVLANINLRTTLAKRTFGRQILGGAIAEVADQSLDELMKRADIFK